MQIIRPIEMSLCAIRGISAETEAKLRRDGIQTWAQLARVAGKRFSDEKGVLVRERIRRAMICRDCGMVDHFVNALPIGHRVRIIAEVYAQTLFLDVETDACTSASRITCLSTLFNGEVKTFVRDVDLDMFLPVWSKAKLLVTFNGVRFDIPKIKKEFGFSANPPHVDLMCEAAHYGFRGGLKRVESDLGFRRAKSIGKNGRDAVDLWWRYKSAGDVAAFHELLEYNREDVLALDFVYRRLYQFSFENF